MADLLDKFMEKAKENIASGYYEAAPAGKMPHASLFKKLSSNDFTLICEIKHASPAGEYSFDYIDVEKAAMDFLQGGADAISVVVEPQIFKGNLLHVPLAKKAGLPVLFKDFVIGKRQILAAKAVGADAVLLIVKVANRLNLDLNALIEDAHSLGLEVLLESYDAEEMAQAAKTDADMLGINNRDLQTLHVDLNRTAAVMAEFGNLGLPIISESGIKNAADIKFVRQHGARGALVGTAIWKAEDIRNKIRELKSGANNKS
jgi:indole-3-glycerol phosphate synthase